MSEEQRVREGDSVTIECVARGVPAPGVSITKYEDLQVTPTPKDPEDNRTSEVSLTSEVSWVWRYKVWRRFEKVRQNSIIKGEN